MAKWSFVLADPKNLTNLYDLGKSSDQSLSVTLNKAGTFSFSYPMRDTLSSSINPYSTAIKCYKGSKLVWSGYVASIDEDISSEKMSVSCVGWLSRLDKRILRRQKSYPYVAGVSTEDAAIIYDLLAEANLAGSAPDGYTIPIVPFSSPATPTWMEEGSRLPNEGVGGATAYSINSAYRGITFEKYSNILEAITSLTEIENGCDIYVDPGTRKLNIYRKKQTVRPEVIFSYNGIGADNIATLQRQIDGSTQINYHVSTGTASVTPQYADDLTTQSQIGILEETTSLSDVSNPNILLAYSGAEILVRKTPHIIYNVSLLPLDSNNTPPAGTSRPIPSAFEDYDVGDLVKLSANLPPRVSINGNVRIFGISLSINPEGQEIISQLQLAP